VDYITTKRPYRSTKKGREREKCWIQWHYFNHLKLCAALAGKRIPAKDVQAAERAWRKLDTVKLMRINEKYFKLDRKLTPAEADKAIDILCGFKKPKGVV
jgi:hypothetical protein